MHFINHCKHCPDSLVASNTLYYYDQAGKILSEFDDRDNLMYDYVYLDGKLVAKISGSKSVANNNVSIPPLIFLLTRDK
jgi:hypothetical protein